MGRSVRLLGSLVIGIALLAAPAPAAPTEGSVGAEMSRSAPPARAATSGDEASTGFPIAGPDQFLGSANTFTDPMFRVHFNQVTPENAGKWGVAAGPTPVSPMNWAGLDAAYTFAKSNGLPFNFHVLLWGNQQPTWMAALPAELQLTEIKKWFAAVAQRYPDIDELQVVNEPTWDPPDCDDVKNQAISDCLTSGNYVRALGGYTGTDGTGWDWVLNAFRLARQYFPDTRLMLNDVNITNSVEATTEYLRIIEILQAEDLIDVVGVQGHAFVTTPGVPGPTVWRRPWRGEGDMAVHTANLDRLASTGLPLQITEVELDGVAADGVPGDEVQLADYRRVFPAFWEHPAVEGITLWGWRQPNHWRNAQNAPIVLSNGQLKPAAHWLFSYVNGIAPVITPGQGYALGDGVANRLGTLEAEDWASRIGRPHLRTFSWAITGGTGAEIFTIAPSSGELRVARPLLLDPQASEYSVAVRVSDGFHTSDEVVVRVTLPSVITMCHDGIEISVDRADLREHVEHGATIGACGPA
jgi:GH35 family endo-1,4-beta-xylanase